MRYLVDSHILLWLMAEPYKLGPLTKKILSEESETVAVSLASLWELGLKYNKGKLQLSAEQVIEGTNALGVEILEIRLEHVLAFNKIIIEHKDPFDLMLCAQATAENMTLVTADRVLLAGFPGSIDARL